MLIPDDAFKSPTFGAFHSRSVVRSQHEIAVAPGDNPAFCIDVALYKQKMSLPCRVAYTQHFLHAPT